MERNYQLVEDLCTSSPNSKLYAFLATNYDISDLAKKISAAKYAQINRLSLRKISSVAI